MGWRSRLGKTLRRLGMKSEWKECTLGDITDLVIDHRGKTPKKLGGDWSKDSTHYRALSAKNIKTGQIVNPESIRFVEPKMYCRWMKDEVQRGDVFITSEAPFGQVLYWNSDEKIVLSQRLFGLRLSKRVCSQFVYYYMTSPAFQSELDARATGTTVFGLRQPELMKCKVNMPSCMEQRKIAAILSSLDDKIENNNAICRNLEEQADSLCDEWIGTENLDVEYKPLIDVADINSSTYSVREGWPCVNYLDTGSVTNGVVESFQRIDLSVASLPSRARRKAKRGDVLFSLVRPNQNHFGMLYEVPENLLVSTGFAVISSSDSRVSNALIFNLVTRINFVELMQGIGEQSVSTYPTIRPDDLGACMIPVSTSEKYVLMQRKLMSIYDEIGNIQCENKRLSDLRDALLPKLMRGEIDVDKVTV